MNRIRLGPVVAAVVVRPRLWATAARVALRAAEVEWWKRPPFLPLPSVDYVRFRLLTQYGDADALPTAADVVRYLEWVRAQPS